MKYSTLYTIVVVALLGSMYASPSNAQDDINDEAYVLTYEATVMSPYENSYLSTYMVVISAGYPTKAICEQVLNSFVLESGNGVTVHTASCGRAATKT